jgi:DNA-3-methyladenine glycosylase
MKKPSRPVGLLDRSFFTRLPTQVAPQLLGKLLVHRVGQECLSGRIIETEAYLGLEDPASHAFRGKSNANAVLFGPPGTAHVYLVYGLHYCLSISAHLHGHAGGVLIRALSPVDGMGTMSRLRGIPGKTDAKWLTGGPGRVCQAFGIERKTHNGCDVTSRDSSLQIFDDGVPCKAILTTRRIGITKAIEAPLRFLCSSGG